ncbi:MAG: FxsA family protein [Deltaproteobacteria bacterium]|nr:FxsA family protein [Deltaproteobacteria bacterium]
MGKLFLLFTLLPFLELYFLLVIGRQVGFWPTLGLVMATGIMGAVLARAEGLRVLRQWQEALSEGRVPEEGVLSSVLILVGGVLLVTPGVLTDVVGFVLLFPPTRRWACQLARKILERNIRKGRIHVVGLSGDPFSPSQGGRRGVGVSSGRIIDVELVDSEGGVRPADAAPPTGRSQARRP